MQNANKAWVRPEWLGGCSRNGSGGATGTAQGGIKLPVNRACVYHKRVHCCSLRAYYQSGGPFANLPVFLLPLALFIA